MEQLISRTKILPPRQRADLMSRPRLLRILTDLIDTKLVLLIAPAGYGKTYALMDLCRTIDLKYAWYSVSSVDDEVSRFVAHFIAALRQTFPEFGAESTTALSNYRPGKDGVERLVIPIVNELYSHVGEHYILVIDDYHLVDGNSDVGLFVSQFVQHVDDNCHIILSSRTLLRLPDLPLLVARGLVSGLNYEDLAFRADELQEFVLQNYDVTLADADAAALVQNTEGWITALMLSAQTMQWHAAGRLRRARGHGIGLYDFLAQQVLDQQEPDLRSFMLRTSVIGEFDGELCKQVLLPAWLPAGRTWHDLIDALERNNLFVVPVGDGGMALRYHHLFQDFLRDRLAHERPTEEREILLRLTEAYAGRNDWEMAHATAQQLDDHTVAAGVIERAGFRMVRAGRFLQVEQWLTGLPAAVADSRPYLVMIRGYCRVQNGNVAEGRLLLSKAIERLEKSDSPATGVALALAYRSIANRVLGKYDEALQDARQALEMLPQGGAAETPAEGSTPERDPGRPPSSLVADDVTIRALAMHNQGVSLQRMGQPLRAIELLRNALVDYEHLEDTQNIAMTLYEIAVAYSDAGRHGDALPLFERALAIWQSAHNVMGQALVLNSIGVHQRDCGDYVRAFEALAEAHACARRSGYPRLEAASLASLGDVYSDLEMWQSAQDVYQQAYTIAQRIDEQFLMLYLELARAVVAWSTGQWEDAYECLDAAGQLVLDRNSTYEWALYRLAMGRYFLARRNAPAALELLEDAGRCFLGGGQPVDAAKAYLYLAAANLTTGDAQGAADRLASALRLINDLELRHPLVVAARGIQALLAALEVGDDQRSILGRLLGEVRSFEAQAPGLLRALRRKAAASLAASEAVAPKVVVYALGRTEVYVDGNLVSLSQWKTKVSRDLFFCFLAFPHGLTKEQIGLLFWPDCTEQQLRTRFKNSIYRLRSALGQDAVLYEDAVYLLDRSLDYEYDVEQFLGLISEATQPVDAALRLKRLQAAVDLYAGDFLADVDTEWARSERERLRNVFLESALSLARLYFEQGAGEETLQVCQRMLTEDPCLEEVHRLAMRVHASTGNRAAVARQYAQCQRALLEEIDAPPSPQTEQLYARLMH